MSWRPQVCVVYLLVSILVFVIGQNEVDDYDWGTRRQEDLRGIRDRFITGSYTSKNSRCTGTRDSERTSGVCKDLKSCLILRGRNTGTCSVFGACCVVERTCTNSTNLKVAYFTSPSFNNLANYPQTCSLRVDISNRDVCQIRLDFEDFQLAGPTFVPPDGPRICTDDSFTISSTNGNNLGIGSLCGSNTGQHIYIPINATSGSSAINLNFNLADRVANPNLIRPTWRIRVTQLECAINNYDFSSVQSSLVSLYQRHKNRKSNNAASDFDLLAPPGCLQYYTEPSGQYESFNYNTSIGPYLANQNYAICFRRTPGSCGIRHTSQGFAMNYNDGTSPFDGGCRRDATDPNSLSDDYILIPGGTYTRTVAGATQPETGQADAYCDLALPVGATVTSTAPGPFYVGVHTDNGWYNGRTEQGFRFTYQILNSGCNNNLP